LLKTVCRCGVVERAYRVTLGRDAEGQIPYRRGQGWRKYDTRLSLLSLFLISFARPASLYCEEYVDIYTYIHIQGVTGGTDQTSGECSLC